MNLNQPQMLRMGSRELPPCGLFSQLWSKRTQVVVEDVVEGLVI
jgi:hypothetical protein